MKNVKMCERCNAAIISNIHDADTNFYKHIRVKYCDQCREIVNREKTNERVKRYKERKRAEREGIQTAELTQLEILRMENNKLLSDYLELIDKVEFLKNEVDRMIMKT